MEGESIICPLDKSIDIEFEHGGDDIIVIGDNSEDISVIAAAKITIGFTDEDKGFTVKLGKEASMEAVIQYLK